MNDVVHARLAGLLDAAMFNRLQREPRDHQLGLEIAARRAKTGDDLRDFLMRVGAWLDLSG